MQKIRKLVPRVTCPALLLTIVCNTVTYYGTRILMNGRMHYDLTNAFDDRIPLIPWTITIYWGCYVFWIVNYILGCRQKQETAFRFLGADIIAKLVCLFCFLVLPTTNVRPVIEEKTIWDTMMMWLYRIDAADNLFPSIHCLTSWLCFIAVRENNRIPKWYKVTSVLIAVAICISTLTTKQHVLIDVFAGVGLAEVSYLFVKKSGFAKWYEKKIVTLSNRLWERIKISEE
ncbi:MAG: phosphatase PAP2 family protein [Lachnospiraceae bacterium]|nr:phosphatase PAP2 family protein [Lachnospiraceae bacterium]